MQSYFLFGKTGRQNWIRTKSTALIFWFTVSFFLHGTLLSLTFYSRASSQKSTPVEEKLEMVLVMGADGIRPDNAPVLAQDDSDGGGPSEEDVRRMSYLPPETEESWSEELEEKRQKLAKIQAENILLMAKLKNKFQLDALDATVISQTNDTDLERKKRAIPQEIAEIANRFEAQQKKPLKTQISPRTRKSEFAWYFKNLQNKLEKTGEDNFPQHEGQKIYGNVLMYIPIFQDGKLYYGDIGAKVLRGSGNTYLDREALRILEKSAPFLPIPRHLLKNAPGGEVWEFVVTFQFTQQNGLNTDFNESLAEAIGLAPNSLDASYGPAASAK